MTPGMKDVRLYICRKYRFVHTLLSGAATNSHVILHIIGAAFHAAYKKSWIEIVNNSTHTRYHHVMQCGYRIYCVRCIQDT